MKEYTLEQALKDSIIKWEIAVKEEILCEGDLSDFLEEHETRIHNLRFACGLCEYHLGNTGTCEKEYCYGCPLFKEIGVECTDESHPFSVWTFKEDLDGAKELLQVLKKMERNLDSE